MTVHAADTMPRLTVSQDDDRVLVTASGEWTIRNAGVVEKAIDTVAVPQAAAVALDLGALSLLDTAGAWQVHKLRSMIEFRGARVTLENINSAHKVLLDEIESHHPPQPSTPRRPNPIFDYLERIGRTSVDIYEEAKAVLGIMGAFGVGLSNSLLNPRKVRGYSVLHNFDRAGLEAASIIALMSFLIGGIIAQQGVYYLQTFGADLFVVDLVGVLAFRELGVLMAAIMIAGRSGSAFTAEIGAMKMREEIDALRVIGLSPIEVLIIPRLLALMLAMPLLTFIADMAAISGGALMTWFYADIPIQTFIVRLHDAVNIQTLMIGIIKAPFMALIIGLIACVEGMKVSGSAESLGRHTTLSVVQAIFMVIVVDGIFAMFFAAIGV